MVAVVVYQLTIRATDDLIEMLIRLYNDLESDAKSDLLQYKMSRLEQADELIETFNSVLPAYKGGTNQSKKISKISEIIRDETDRLISSCEDYTAYSKTGYLHFMEKRYVKIRSLVRYCLNLITIDLNSKDKKIYAMVTYIKKHSLKQKEKVILSNKEPDFNKLWMSPKWKVICKLGKNKICRLKFELLVLSKLISKLVSKELFIKSSFNYSDYRSALIKKGAYGTKIREYQKIINMPVDPGKFGNFVKEQLKTACIKANNNLEGNGKSVFRGGKLSLKKVTSSNKPDGFEVIDKEISRRLNDISLLDIIISVCKALNVQDYFSAFFGKGGGAKERLKQIIATFFCYGCNIGAQEVEKSIVDINRKQIGWINATYVSEKSLDKCIFHIVNAYNQFKLPKYWGDGKHVSVDGTQWLTHTKNLMAQYHIRYRGYGGIAYYHVSDKYIALFSNFIACGVHEGKYLLDALEENESNIKPEYVHGDHHAQSLVIFGLAYLLGIKIMPRMRKINKVAFYKPELAHHYGEIDPLFKNNKINWKLINRYTKDMFRIVLSIKEGRIKPSEILSRMSTRNNKSKLYLAFRELGRAIRTIYLLDYISDFDLRKIVHAATCKSEEFNDYVTWIAFSDDKIKKNRRQEQRKFIKYNHLVTNMVLLYNVQAMTVILKEIISEGYLITEDILRSLSPYRKSHIIRLGIYELNLNVPEIPLEIGDFELLDNKYT